MSANGIRAWRTACTKLADAMTGMSAALRPLEDRLETMETAPDTPREVDRLWRRDPDSDCPERVRCSWCGQPCSLSYVQRPGSPRAVDARLLCSPGCPLHDEPPSVRRQMVTHVIRAEVRAACLEEEEEED